MGAMSATQRKASLPVRMAEMGDGSWPWCYLGWEEWSYMFLNLLTGAVPHGATFNNDEFHFFTLSGRLNCHEMGLPSIVALSKNLKCAFSIARVQNFVLIVIRIS